MNVTTLNTRNQSQTKAIIAKLYECDPYWFTFIEPLFGAVDIIYRIMFPANFISFVGPFILVIWVIDSTLSTKMLPHYMQRPAILVGEGGEGQGKGGWI